MPRTAGAIALWPTCKAQGSYFFLNLHSGKRIIIDNTEESDKDTPANTGVHKDNTLQLQECMKIIH